MWRSPIHELLVPAGAVFATNQKRSHVRHFSDVAREYNAIRTEVGISDWSDLTKIRIRGNDARDFIDHLVSGNVQNLPEGAILHSLVLTPEGTVACEVFVYCNFDDFLVVTDASAQAPLEAILASLPRSEEVEIIDESETLGAVRFDGPKAADLARALVGLDATGLRIHTFMELPFGGHTLLVARVGSTGEFGYLCSGSAEAMTALTERLFALAPGACYCGREVFDLLILEMRGFNPSRTLPRQESPLDAGLHWAIDLQKPDFIGRSSVLERRAGGSRRRLTCFVIESDESAITGQNAPILIGGQDVGYVADALRSPAVGRMIGVGYIDREVSWTGVPVIIEGQPARLVSAPFVLTRSNASVGTGS